MEEYRTTIDKLDEEITRAKLWLVENNFHVGTSVYMVTRNYRDELKKLRRTLRDNLSE